jgi:hypothetical protein
MNIKKAPGRPKDQPTTNQCEAPGCRKTKSIDVVEPVLPVKSTGLLLHPACREMRKTAAVEPVILNIRKW